jgi:Arc/MetJ-type ribon-helix-helix transcriptional regulator
MSGFKKIAVSIPAETYRSLEKARGHLGKSRSEVVAFAVREWLRSLDAGEASRRYVDGYLRLPERVAGDDVSTVAAATADWSTWEPGEPSRASESRSQGSASQPRAGEPRGRGRKR